MCHTNILIYFSKIVNQMLHPMQTVCSPFFSSFQRCVAYIFKYKMATGGQANRPILCYYLLSSSIHHPNIILVSISKINSYSLMMRFNPHCDICFRFIYFTTLGYRPTPPLIYPILSKIDASFHLIPHDFEDAHSNDAKVVSGGGHSENDAQEDQTAQHFAK